MADVSQVLGANNAYSNAAKIKIDGGSDAGSSKPDFIGMVGDAVDGAIKTTREAETMSMKALTGEVSVDELAVAVANAELTLRTVTAVRDKIIGAYQDIIKMPI